MKSDNLAVLFYRIIEFEVPVWNQFRSAVMCGVRKREVEAPKESPHVKWRTRHLFLLQFIAFSPPFT